VCGMCLCRFSFMSVVCLRVLYAFVWSAVSVCCVLCVECCKCAVCVTPTNYMLTLHVTLYLIQLALSPHLMAQNAYFVAKVCLFYCLVGCLGIYISCRLGSYQSEGGKVTCEGCDAGRFAENRGMEVCELCPGKTCYRVNSLL